MAEEKTRNTKLGFFVLAGTLLLVTALYLIGSKQNLFGSTFRLKARFNNVNGLMQGNNVRFAGIDVGTVESVNIVSDTAVDVVMQIEKNVQAFIKKNAIAAVGTDGLMGNKLVNINSVKEAAPPVEENDALLTLKPIEMDEMVRTLDITNTNMQVITGNLRSITDKINSKGNLWNLLLDTIISENIKSSVVNIKAMSNQGLMVTGDLRDLLSGVKNGKGSIGALITDTLLSGKIRQTVVQLKMISDTAASITGNLAPLSRQLKQGKGNLGILMKDTMLVHNLNKGILSLDTGAIGFNQNMEALKHTWPLKKYFRKKMQSKK